MALTAENALQVNRHCSAMLLQGFSSGLIGTANGYWTGSVVTIAALQAAIYTPSTNSATVTGLHEYFNNLARHISNALTAAKNYGVLTDANISTVQGTAAGSRQSTFMAFFNTNDSSVPAAGITTMLSFAGAAG